MDKDQLTKEEEKKLNIGLLLVFIFLMIGLLIGVFFTT